jgi:hypothetical protein
MRRGFRLGRSDCGHRPNWPSHVLSVQEECYEELAVIADHFASFVNQRGAARTVTAVPPAAVSRHRRQGDASTSMPSSKAPDGAANTVRVEGTASNASAVARGDVRRREA